MNGNDGNGSGKYAAEAATYVVKIIGVGTKALDVDPRALALASADRVVWEFAGRKYSVRFAGHSPFKPHPATPEPREPEIIEADARGIVEGQVHPQAKGGAYFYDVILNEEPKPQPAKGVLLVEVTATVIIRGPVDPM